jgi:hypothetical protein
VVQDDNGTFDVLLGMRWKSGASRVLGLQLLEPDDVHEVLDYEVELRDRV